MHRREAVCIGVSGNRRKTAPRTHPVQLIKHLLLSLTGIRWLGAIKPLAGLA